MVSIVVQLPLFDISKTVATSYQVGDRVKLCKKPLAASYLKKGDVVEIAAIHPLDGSIKFWNERSERWEFAHPEEIARVVDSPTPAEVANAGEVPHSESLATTQIEAVGESKFPPDGFDSPTLAELAVGESKFPPDDDYLALNAISTYRPRGTARGGEYFRLSYKDGGKVRTVHIRGGNINSPISQAKVQEVRSLLASGMPPSEIAILLRD